MKKLTDIKIGILIGLIASCAFIAYKPITEYYALANNDQPVDSSAASDGKKKDVNYNDVFASGGFKDLYLLIHQNAVSKPRDEALKTVAAAYGFTPAEAQSVLDGSIEPIVTKYGDSSKTQKNIYDRAVELREDFMDIYQMLALEQELTIGGVASEIFSNGEISDSGFDLIYDLTLIEEVIFGTTTDASLGGPLDFSSLNDKEDATDELLESGDDNAEPNIPDVYNSLNKADTVDEVTAADNLALEDFDPASLVQVQENDICPKPETKIEGALEDFKTNPPVENNLSEDPNKKPVISAAAAAVAASNPDSLAGVLIPEVPDKWEDKADCNGFFYSIKTNTEDGSVTEDKWTEDNSTYSEDENAAPADTTAKNSSKSQIAAEFFICLEATTKWAKYGTVVSDRPCVKCETEKILTYLNKTLENSFVPNKATGNFLEPSKCKSALISSTIDIKLNFIWSPIQTPRKDEAIKLKSLRGEWDKLMSRSKPLILRDIPMTWLGDNINATATATAQQNVSESASYSELMEEVSVIKNTFAKQAAEGSELFSTISAGENFVTYSQDVMKEVDQMTNYFRNFESVFTKLATETCPNILSKPKVK